MNFHPRVISNCCVVSHYSLFKWLCGARSGDFTAAQQAYVAHDFSPQAGHPVGDAFMSERARQKVAASKAALPCNQQRAMQHRRARPERPPPLPPIAMAASRPPNRFKARPPAVRARPCRGRGAEHVDVSASFLFPSRRAQRARRPGGAFDRPAGEGCR